MNELDKEIEKRSKFLNKKLATNLSGILEAKLEYLEACKKFDEIMIRENNE